MATCLEQDPDHVYRELRRIARRQLGPARAERTLGTTALVHEAWMRLVGEAAKRSLSREHALNLAAKVMRQLACDEARRKLREHRVFDRGAAGEDAIDREDADVRDALHFAALDEALAELEAIDARQVRVIECKYFVGLSSVETAAALGLSLRTVERAWTDARAWLAARLRH